MKVYWWQGGVHVEPENDKDRAALMALTAHLPGNGVRVGGEAVTGPVSPVELGDK